jgi:hypothetical protein
VCLKVPLGAPATGPALATPNPPQRKRVKGDPRLHFSDEALVAGVERKRATGGGTRLGASPHARPTRHPTRHCALRGKGHAKREGACTSVC